MRRFHPLWLVPAVLVLAGLGYNLLWADEPPSAVELEDGQMLIGQVTDRDEGQITIVVEGETIRVPADDVRNFNRRARSADIFEFRRQRLEEGDHTARYNLARWAVAEGLLDEAAEQLGILSEVEIESQELQDRIDVLEMILEQRREADAARPERPDEPVDVTETDPEDLREWMLSDEQINIMRVYEVELYDRTTDPPRPLRPNIVIDNETIERFLDAYRHDDRVPRTPQQRAAFRRLPGHQQIELFFEVRAREFYADIRMRQDPRSLATWRNNLHPRYVINNCATAGCHGSPGDDGRPVGGLQLFQPPRGNVRDLHTAYTNLILLQNFSNAAGYQGIDRIRPEESLLVQHSLPRSVARRPHPEVDGWRSRFPTNYERNRDYRALIDWMGNQLNTARADGYGFTYRPPWEEAEQQAPADDDPEQ